MLLFLMNYTFLLGLFENITFAEEQRINIQLRFI